MGGLKAVVLLLLLGLPALAAWGILLTASRLTRLRLRGTTLEPVPRAGLPPDIRATLDTVQPLLASLGFDYRYTTSCQRIIVLTGDVPLFTDVYEHEASGAHALASPSATPGLEGACTLVFATQLRDGQTLATANCFAHDMLCAPPGWQVHDDYLPDPAEAWRRHLKRAQAAGGRGTADGLAFFRASKSSTENLMLHAQARGLVRAEGGTWRIRWRAAVAYAWRMFRGRRRTGKVRAVLQARRGRPGAAAAPATSADADIRAFEQQLAVLRATRGSRARKVKVFLVTALLFLAVGSLWISWTFLPVLLAVVALHEGGHFLAMKLSGYRNLAVFFVPGLGGAATGEKPGASPWEKLFVYLAGPVPGIALALAGLAAQSAGLFEPAPWFREFLVACLLVNYLNLLPITPLDGGRVVEVFLFARWPVARFLFALCGLCAFLAFAAWSSDPVTLGIALLLALALPHQWRLMRVDRAVRRRPGETLDERGAIRRIFGVLQNPRFAAWPFEVRAAAASTLLPELQGRRARALEAIGALSLHAGLLAAPLLAAAVALPQVAAIGPLLLHASPAAVRDEVDPDPVPAQRLPTPRDWYAEVAHLDTLPAEQRLAVLLGALDEAYDRDDDAHGQAWLQEAWALAEQRPPRDAERARTLLARARLASEPAAREAWLRQVVQELDGAGDDASALLLADAKQQLANEADASAEQRLAWLRDVVRHREQAEPAGSYALQGARRALAGALDADAWPEEAETLLRQTLASLALPPSDDRSAAALRRRVQNLEARTELAWFLTAHGRAREAVAVLDPGLALVPARVSVSWDVPDRQAREAKLWAELQYAQPEQLRASWRQYEQSRRLPLQGKVPVVSHELDRFVVAQAVHDDAGRQQALAGLARAVQSRQGQFMKAHFCEPPPPAGWRRAQEQARTEGARASGLCAAS